MCTTTDHVPAAGSVVRRTRSDERDEPVTSGRAGDVGPEGAGAVRVPTGDHAGDEALTGLDRLTAAHVKEHVAIFESIHSVLQDRLADTEA